jgi:hypothetical protein
VEPAVFSFQRRMSASQGDTQMKYTQTVDMSTWDGGPSCTIPVESYPVPGPWGAKSKDDIYTVGGRFADELDAALERARKEGLPESIIASYLKLRSEAAA